MPARSREAHSSLYTVRVWSEEVENGGIEWRGKVQSIPDGETLFFRDWDAMTAFIRDSSDRRVSVRRDRALHGAVGD